MKHPQQPLLGISKPNLRFNRDNIKLKLESVQVDILLPVVYQSPTKLSEEAQLLPKDENLFVLNLFGKVGTELAQSRHTDGTQTQTQMTHIIHRHRHR